MDFAERKELVLRNTEEIVTEDELDEILQEKDKPVAYIGYAPTGMLHIGHFATIRKIADFLKAGFKFKVLIADVHAELDVEKTPLDLVRARSEVYEEGIKGMIEAGGVDFKDVEFIRGSSYQHGKEYQKGYMHLMENATLNRAQRASSEVVRHEEGMKASGILYPFLQIMDCVALDVDVAYSGTDQRRIYMLGRETLPDIGEKKPTCIFFPLLGGLSGGKMSASDSKSKVNITDSEEEIKDKMDKAYCPEGEIKDNNVLGYARYLIFPVLRDKGEKFVISRPEKYGGDVSYENYKELEKDFLSGELHPQDLKESMAESLFEILKPVRERFEGREDLLKRSYPESE